MGQLRSRPRPRARTCDRRGFLKGLAAAGAAAAFPTIVRATALGKDGATAASERIVLGNIGVGGRGGFLLGWFLADSDVQVRVVCDVDVARREAARKRVDTQYGRTGGASGAKSCDATTDFHEVLARSDLDGVVVATPDHWHALITILAARAGKDVYCEKPMASVIADGRAAADALRRYGRVFQTGSHERSTATVRYACELVRNGRIGKLHTIRTFLPTGDKHTRAVGPFAVPEGFDYDRWLGPAPWAAYHPQRCHGSFRWVTDYSDGELTDRGAHVNDIALLGAGPGLLTGPVEILGDGKCIDDPIWDVPYEYHIEFTYASGLKMIVDSAGPESGRGIRFEGSDGWIFVAIHGGALSASSPAILKSKIELGEIQLGRSVGHGADWLHAIRTRGPTMAPAEEGHRTASFCHLSLAAVLLKRKLKWDLQREVFLDDEEANNMSMIRRSMREPWRL